MHGLQTIKRLNETEQAIVAQALAQATQNTISDRLDQAFQQYLTERDSYLAAQKVVA